MRQRCTCFFSKTQCILHFDSVFKCFVRFHTIDLQYYVCLIAPTLIVNCKVTCPKELLDGNMINCNILLMCHGEGSMKTERASAFACQIEQNSLFYCSYVICNALFDRSAVILNAKHIVPETDAFKWKSNLHFTATVLQYRHCYCWIDSSAFWTWWYSVCCIGVTLLSATTTTACVNFCPCCCYLSWHLWHAGSGSGSESLWYLPVCHLP